MIEERGETAVAMRRPTARERSRARGGMKTAKRKQTIFIVSALAIGLANFCVFWVQINVNSILLAFQQTTPKGISYGFSNFTMLFHEFQNPYSVLSEALRNTLIFFAFGMFVQMPLGFLFSYFLYKKIAGYKVFRYVFFLPNIISAVVLATLVQFMMGVNGPITVMWEKMFGDAPYFFADSRYALKSLLVYGLWSGFGINIVLYTAAMCRIPADLLEYAQLDGLGMGREIVCLIIPLIWPILSTMILLSCVGIFSASGPILLFTKGEYGTYTLSYWIYAKTAGLAGRNLPYASAVGLFFTLVGTPIALFVKWLTDRVEAVEY